MIKTKGRGCGTKRRHPDRGGADRQMWALIRGGAAPSRLNTYRCKHCNTWHVGHLPKARKTR